MKRTAAARASALRGAVHRRAALMLSVALAVSACHTVPLDEPRATPAEPSRPPEMPPAALCNTEVPAPSTEALQSESPKVPRCACVDNTPKPAARHKPKPVAQTPPSPPASPVSKVPLEPSVKQLDGPSLSILGTKVRGQDGEDLGRVVDVLTDRQGRVRVAVMEFGGFLGVGNRRIAVDWSLLKFQPRDPDAPVTVEASKAQLQGTPEYKGSEPAALMAPAAPASAPAAPP